MKDYNGFVPLLVRNSCLSEEFDNSGNYRFISRQHTELNYISINKTAKDILDLCTGRSLESIVVDISNKYLGIGKEEIRADVVNTLYSLWRLGVVAWKDKKYPFYLDETDGKIVYSYISENPLVRLYRTPNIYNAVFRSCNLDYKMETSEKFIRRSWYNYSRLYFSISINGQTNAVLCLSYNPFLQAFDVLFVDAIPGFIVTRNILIGLANFVLKCCKQTIIPIAKCLGENTAFYFYSSSNVNWFKEINPEFCGELRKEFKADSIYIFKINSSLT